MSEEPTSRPRRGIPDGSDEPEVESAPRTGEPQHDADDTATDLPSSASRSADGSSEARAPRRGFASDEDSRPARQETPVRAPARSAVTPDTPVPPPRVDAAQAGAHQPSEAEDAHAAFRRPTDRSPRPGRRRRRPADRSQAASPAAPSPSADDTSTPSAPESPASESPQSTAPQSEGRTPGRAEPGSDELVVERSPMHRWWVWAIVAVLLVAIVVVTVSRMTHKPPVAAPTPSASASGRPSGPTVTPLRQDALMSVAEATRLSPKAAWRVESTESKVPDDSPDAISCIVRDTNHPNPLSTWQRSFSASTKTATSALHRVDGYADAATAKAAFTVEAASLAACDSVPALIVSASSVTGLADQSMALTVAFQGATTQYHTIVLARFGREIQAVDAADNGAAIPAQNAAEAMAAAAGRSCKLAGGGCPATVSTTETVPPASGEAGWLITSDLPRLTPDQGEWQAAAVATVSSKGTQCEGVTLATVSGPVDRKQRTYLLYKDSSAPQGFGVDSLQFTFKDAAGATDFAKKVGDSIAGCAKTLTTAKVSDSKSFTGVGEKGSKITGRSYLVTQDAGSGQQAVFQVSITSVGDKVTYLLANVTSSYKFSDDAWSQLAVRAAQRATQSN